MNDFTVVVKRIVLPSPLVFRRIETLLVPVLNQPVAFDFEIGDWVKPYGNGKSDDVWLTADKRMTARHDYDMKVTLTFSNSVDGIQEFSAPSPNELYLASDLMPPQEAPDAGYNNSIVVFRNMHPGRPVSESLTENRNYIFRVRSQTNEANKVVAANVGWIRRDIALGVGDKDEVGVMFGYYYNPDPKSRSLEPLDADKSRRSKKP